MPKRVGGDSLGHHKCLHIKFQAYLFFLVPMALMFLSNFYQLDTMFTYMHRLLFGCCTFGLHIVTCLMDYALDDAPPTWAHAKTHVLITQHHYWKHGHIKTFPTYPTIHFGHLHALVTSLPTHSLCEDLCISDTRLATKLCHIQWESYTTFPSFSLPNYDVNVTFPCLQ